jgi:hypothetical protein
VGGEKQDRATFLKVLSGCEQGRSKLRPYHRSAIRQTRSFVCELNPAPTTGEAK